MALKARELAAVTTFEFGGQVAGAGGVLNGARIRSALSRLTTEVVTDMRWRAARAVRAGVRHIQPKISQVRGQ